MSPDKLKSLKNRFPDCGLSFKSLLGLIVMGFIFIPLSLEFILTHWIDVNKGPVLLLVGQGVTLIYWLWVFMYFKRKYPEALAEMLGLQTEESVLGFLFQGLQIFLQVVLFAFAYNLIIHGLGISQVSPYEGLSYEELVVIACFAVVSAPFVEEILFRGAVLTLLMNYFYNDKYAALKAVVFSSFVFTVFHGWYLKYPTAIGFVFGISLIFGFARLRFKSSLPGVLAHGINNALAAWIAIHVPQEAVSQAMILNYNVKLF